MKVAIYCRLSSEDKNKIHKTDESESIQNQKTMLIRYATEQDWEIYGIYCDEDYAGSDRSRPEFNRLISDAENRAFDIVLCKQQSRFTREMELVEKYIHTAFVEWGIRFVGLVDSADTSNRGNKKARQINGLVNEWQLEDMSESIRSVFKSKRKAGVYTGSFALYGYMKDPEHKGHLIIDEEAAMIVRDIFKLYTEGVSKQGIADILNKRDIPNPTLYKQLHGIKFRSPKGIYDSQWCGAVIGNMLVNQMYIGNMVQGRQCKASYKSKKIINKPESQWDVVPDTHEPIIDKETWEKTQTMIKRKYKPFTAGDPMLFKSKVYCKECGYILSGRRERGKDGYYNCRRRIKGTPSCNVHIPQKILVNVVTRKLEGLSKYYFDVDDIQRSIVINRKKSEELALVVKSMREENKKIKDTDLYLKNLYVDKVKGVITEEQFVDFANDFNNTKNQALSNLEKLKFQKANIERDMDKDIDLKALLEKYSKKTELDRESIDAFIDSIEVGRKAPETKQREIIIHWNF